ncbi:MAG: winged helix-turn-helix transcriptional regulator [Chloroflexi bacterium]|nr:winged helix-turn-helix transcriptional regulator [Chloroflexota bacterium]
MYDEALKPSGLRSTQLPVLVTLVSIGQMTVNELANDLVMDRTSLSRLLRPLVIRGLVSMTPGEDRRIRELSITPLGRETLVAAIPMWDSIQEEVLGRLGQIRWRDLRESLSVAAASSN